MGVTGQLKPTGVSATTISNLLVFLEQFAPKRTFNFRLCGYSKCVFSTQPVTLLPNTATKHWNTVWAVLYLKIFPHLHIRCPLGQLMLAQAKIISRHVSGFTWLPLGLQNALWNMLDTCGCVCHRPVNTFWCAQFLDQLSCNKVYNISVTVFQIVYCNHSTVMALCTMV